MDIRPIRTEADYEAALEEIALLMVDDPMPGTPEGDRLDVLATLVQVYEAQHHPVLPPDPIEAIKFRMEQQGLTVADLKPYIGPPQRVYEVLSRKRALNRPTHCIENRLFQQQTWSRHRYLHSQPSHSGNAR